jgi:hypothetical protein
MGRDSGSIGLHGLKPLFLWLLNVAAEAATLKDYLWDGFISGLKFEISDLRSLIDFNLVF